MSETIASTAAREPAGPNPLLCSPDGEPRGLLARAGDIFPLAPGWELAAEGDPVAGPEPAGGGARGVPGVRPWGLRFLQAPDPSAGKHDGTAQATTAPPGGDTKSPEDMTND